MDLRRLIKVGLLGGMFFCLFGTYFYQSSPVSVRLRFESDLAVFREWQTQWMIYVELVICYLLLICIYLRTLRSLFHWFNVSLGIFFIGIISINYLTGHVPSTDVLILLVTACLGLGIKVWIVSEKKLCDGKNYNSFQHFLFHVMLFFFALASICTINSKTDFMYRGDLRWCGPWVNPNVYGVLMGTGLIFTIGSFPKNIVNLRKRRNFFRSDNGIFVGGRLRNFLQIGFVFLWILAAVLMAHGLIKSYSRGSWLAFGSGLAYLGLCWASSYWPMFDPKWFARTILEKFFQKTFPLLMIIFFSIATLLFWRVRHQESGVIRRTISAVVANDFSWRFRIKAWEGSMQIMADQPWFGCGCNKFELTYDSFYRNINVPEGMAVETNDYFWLGGTFGISSLLCFLAYVWLLVTGGLYQCNTFENSSKPDYLLKLTCRAGVVALLVFFWFDGGLFIISTASVFWILVELGREDHICESKTLTRIE